MLFNEFGDYFIISFLNGIELLFKSSSFLFLSFKSLLVRQFHDHTPFKPSLFIKFFKSLTMLTH
jgi:hypothetical protein